MRFVPAALLALALAACGGHDRGGGQVSVPPVASDDDSGRNALPTPGAAPGTSVTGMPTEPPPPPAVAEAPPPPAGPVDAPAPQDALADDTTASVPADVATAATPPAPPVAGAAPVAAVPTAPNDVAGAASVVTQYFAALSAGALAKAQALWATTPNDSMVLQLARGTTFNVALGAPLVDAGGHVAVPVDVRGNADDGSSHHLQATYTLQRAPNAGAWRIQSAAVREAAP